MKRSFIAYAVALVALSATLAGCNGGGDPTPSPTVTSSSPSASPSVSASPSSSPSPSVSIPAEAMQQTPEGAVAFVKFYFDQVNRAWTTPDETVLPPLSDEQCNSCKNLQADAAELSAKGQRMDPAPVAVSEVLARDGAAPGRQFVSATLAQTGARVLDAAGSVIDQDQPTSGAYNFALIWKGDRWLMQGIDAA